MSRLTKPTLVFFHVHIDTPHNMTYTWRFQVGQVVDIKGIEDHIIFIRFRPLSSGKLYILWNARFNFLIYVYIL